MASRTLASSSTALLLTELASGLPAGLDPDILLALADAFRQDAADFEEAGPIEETINPHIASSLFFAAMVASRKFKGVSRGNMSS